jgi:hypothetical protein
VRANKAIKPAASKFLRLVTDPAVERATEQGAIKIKVDRVLDEAEQLQDPASPAAMDLSAALMELEQDDPELAQAVAAKIMQRSQFLLEKAGPRPVTAMGMPKPYDPITEQKLQRYAYAMAAPAKALERIANGTASPEDRETIQTLHAPMWNEFARDVMTQLSGKNVSHSAKVRASLALGLPLADSLSPERLAFTQSRMGQSNAAAAQSKAADMTAQAAPLTGDRIAFARS